MSKIAKKAVTSMGNAISHRCCGGKYYQRQIQWRVMTEDANKDALIRWWSDKIERVIHILSRWTKIICPSQNLVLVNQLLSAAYNVWLMQHPANMQGTSLNIVNVVAGTKFAENLNRWLRLLMKSARCKYYRFVDELHTIVGAGGGTDSVTDASNIMNLH